MFLSSCPMLGAWRLAISWLGLPERMSSRDQETRKWCIKTEAGRCRLAVFLRAGVTDWTELLEEEQREKEKRRKTCAVSDQIVKMGPKVSFPPTLFKCLLTCVTLWSYLSAGRAFAKLYRRPNVVLILTDDLDVAIGGLVGEVHSFSHFEGPFPTLNYSLIPVASREKMRSERLCDTADRRHSFRLESPLITHSVQSATLALTATSRREPVV